MNARWRWPVAVTLFIIGVLSIAQPVQAQDGTGIPSFSWGQVIVLVAVGVAWGDNRAQMRELRSDVEDLKKSRK